MHQINTRIWDLERLSGPEEAARITRQLEAGSVWVNVHQEGDPMASFGGHKESGIGYEWGHGGLKSYCNAQSLFLKTPHRQSMA